MPMHSLPVPQSVIGIENKHERPTGKIQAQIPNEDYTVPSLLNAIQEPKWDQIWWLANALNRPRKSMNAFSR